jgi:hypothetical protein
MSIYQQILNFPEINGFAPSWSSVEIAIGGVKKVVASKSINYDNPLTIGKGWGTSSRKIIRTRGQQDSTGTWEVYRSAWDMLMADVLAIGGRFGFAETALPITVSYAEPSNPAMTVMDSLLGVRCHSPKVGGSEGTDPLVVSFELDIMEIVYGSGRAGPGFTQLSPIGGIIPG